MTSVNDPTDTTTMDWLDRARPKLRDAVRIGPPLLKGETVVHVIGDRETQAFVRVGTREAFLMRQLDGRRSLADIGAVYAERFGKRLGAEHWQHLLGLLSARGLVEPASEEQLTQVREKAAQARRPRRSLLLWRQPVRVAVDAVPAVARWTGGLLRPAVAVPLSVVGALIGVLAALNWQVLYDAVEASPSRLTVSLAAVIGVWTVLACHEMGHGVAAHRYGGRPAEMGVMWRLPLVTFYCKTDDTMTFERRSDRVATSFAGLYVNLIALLPIAALWRFGPQQGWWHGLAGALLLFVTVVTAANLVPVLRLDGYNMLEHATSTMNLQSESFRFLGRFMRRGPAGVAGYPTRARVLYTAYAVLAVAILGTALVLVVRLWFVTLADLVGPLGATAILIGEAVLVALLLWWAVRWQQRRQQAGTSKREL